LKKKTTEKITTILNLKEGVSLPKSQQPYSVGVSRDVSPGRDKEGVSDYVNH